jgi:hypothetical protein
MQLPRPFEKTRRPHFEMAIIKERESHDRVREAIA